MFNVCDPLEEYEEGQEYERDSELAESFMTYLELEEIVVGNPRWLRELGLPELTAAEFEELFSKSQPVDTLPINDAGEEMDFLNRVETCMATHSPNYRQSHILATS